MPIFFFCVFGVVPYGERRNYINKISPKSRDNPVKLLFMCFFSSFVFSLPIQTPKPSEEAFTKVIWKQFLERDSKVTPKVTTIDPKSFVIQNQTIGQNLCNFVIIANMALKTLNMLGFAEKEQQKQYLNSETHVSHNKSGEGIDL